MKRWQAIALILMAVLAISLFCGVAVLSQALFQRPDPATIITQLEDNADSSAAIEDKSPASDDATATFTPRATATPTALPTATNTPVPTATPLPLPTATPTRVVVDTPTPLPTFTPLPTKIPTATNTPVVRNNGGGGAVSNPSAPAPAPASQYPFKIVAGPLSYKTTNHIFVILAKVVAGNVPQPGYQLVGTHSPTGFQWESPLSCPDLCKASGPEAIYDKDGNLVKKWAVQKGNLFFESPNYDTGVWSLMLVDAHGQQASDVFQIGLDSEDKQWFYYEFSR